MDCAKKLIAETSTTVEAKINPLKQASHHPHLSQRTQAYKHFKIFLFGPLLRSSKCLTAESSELWWPCLGEIRSGEQSIILLYFVSERRVRIVTTRMNLGLENRVAIVTGSSQGIGKAIAVGMSREGAKVTICARNKDTLTNTAKEIQNQTGNEVLPIGADLTKREDIDNLVAQTFDNFQRIDVLVNNTGGPPSTTFMETLDQHWQDACNTLLMSVVHASRAVIPHMKKAKWGRIINMTSFVAKQPYDRLILSNTLRAGIFGLSKTLSNELAPYGVLVNAVCPGWTLTRRVKELAKTRAEVESKTPEEIMKSWQDQIPLRRLAQPSEIADVAVFLASERASYITGGVIQVDGGVIKSLY